MNRNLAVDEYRGTGERLSPTYLQTEREMRRLWTSCAICRVTSRWVAVEFAGIQDVVFQQCTVTTRPNRVDLGWKNGSGRNDSERFFRSIYRGQKAESRIFAYIT